MGKKEIREDGGDIIRIYYICMKLSNYKLMNKKGKKNPGSGDLAQG